MKASSSQQLNFLIRDVLPVLIAVVGGMTYDPGHSDLDDEQPINVRMTLGDYRRASRLKYELEKHAPSSDENDIPMRCTRADGHDGPCNGFPKKTCVTHPFQEKA